MSPWIQVLGALLTPTLAVAATVLACLNYRLAQRRRLDELFDRRYAFYERAREWWLSTAGPNTPPSSPEDVIPLAEEAGFLFGPDVARDLSSLGGRSHDGSPFFPNHDFTAIFAKYLRL